MIRNALDDRIKDLEFELSYLKSCKAAETFPTEFVEKQEYAFTDLIDCTQLQDLMNDLYDLVGLGVGIVDNKGKVLVSTGWQDICTKFHRVHPETCIKCNQSDIYFITNLNAREPVEYKCGNGMWDTGSLIIIDGKILAGIYFGQYFYDDEKIDYDFFEKQAEKYGFNKVDYLNSLKKVPVISRQKAKLLITYYA